MPIEIWSKTKLFVPPADPEDLVRLEDITPKRSTLVTLDGDTLVTTDGYTLVTESS